MTYNHLHEAALKGDVDKARELLKHDRYDVNCRDSIGCTALHWACGSGHVYMVRILISEFKADTTFQDVRGNTPLHDAAYWGRGEVALTLITEFDCDANLPNNDGYTSLHRACEKGDASVVRMVGKYASVSATANNGDTPLHIAAARGHKECVEALLQLDAPVKLRNASGETAFHIACERGHAQIAKMIGKDAASLLATTNNGDTPLHIAAARGHKECVEVLLQLDAPTSLKNASGETALHIACERGHASTVKIIGKSTSLLATTNDGDTPLHIAAARGHKECVEALPQLDAPTSLKNASGKTALHIACERGHASTVKIIGKSTSLLATTNDGDTPLHIAAARGHKECVEALLQLDAPTSLKNEAGETALHVACEEGYTQIVKMIAKDISLVATTRYGNTPLHIAAAMGHEECVEALLQLDPPIMLRNVTGITAFDIACEMGYGSIVKRVDKNEYLLATKYGNTPLHIAAARGHKECVEALLQLDPPMMLRNALGKTALHVACEEGHAQIAKMIGKDTSLLATTEDGDTPLHIAAARGHKECVEALLQLDAPLMLRNAAGKTVRDVAQYDVKPLLDTYFAKNRAKIHVNYDKIIQQAKKTYSNAERIVRVFVIGNPGAGKSSFVEAMKREGFFDSFSTVSVSTHTAGIIPSIHTSKHYGRVLFYDFAGDPEYYSSHAAILENLASTKGDNIFVIVIDLREDILTVRNTLQYWLSFIGYQCGSKNLLVIGSHRDILTEEIADKKIQKISAIQSEHVEMNCFTLNCCKPRSKELEEIKNKIVQLTKDSPKHKLSTETSVILGLLVKDFSNVTACSTREILSSIEDTGISLPKNITAFLRELHDVGVLFMIGNEQCDSPQVILNVSKLTNEVHKLLFSKEAEFLEKGDAISSFNIGIIPQSLLDKFLPQHITKECLVQLQYCQEISQHDVGAFPSVSKSESSSQSFLFFPALCTVGKSDVSRVTPPSIGYSIGWLAQCADTTCDYFPPRFLHVLLLRLVFSFTLAVPSQHQTDTSDSPDHSHLKRRCTMWNCGVRWSMEEGVECMVELVNGNKGVVVINSSEERYKESCINIFRRIISCVMEAKAEFCHPIRPQFFLLDHTQSADYLNEDNLFSMSDVDRVLASCDKNVVLSITGKRTLKRECLDFLHKLTLWNSLFSLDFASVLHYLKDVVKEVYELFIHLGLPKSLVDTIEETFPKNVERIRIELVDAWISSSSPDPPCWWQLVQALKTVKYGRLAKELETQYSKCIV